MACFGVVNSTLPGRETIGNVNHFFEIFRPVKTSREDPCIRLAGGAAGPLGVPFTFYLLKINNINPTHQKLSLFQDSFRKLSRRRDRQPFLHILLRCIALSAEDIQVQIRRLLVF